MRRAFTFLIVAWVTCTGCGREAEPPAQPARPVAPPATLPVAVAPAVEPSSEAALLRGELPKGPQSEVMLARCQICHTLDYITQQRLSGVQWDKTLTKMQKWGSPLTDDEKKALGPYLASTWRSELPDRASARVPTPEGAVPVSVPDER